MEITEVPFGFFERPDNVVGSPIRADRFGSSARTRTSIPDEEQDLLYFAALGLGHLPGS